MKQSLLILLLLLTAAVADSQTNDFGAWGSIAVNHKFSRRLSGSIEEQDRFDQNAGHLSQYFTEAGLTWQLSRRFRIGGYYRFINVNRENYLSKRHRWFVDVTFKSKYRKIQLLLRERFQEQVRDIQSSDYGKIPSWYSRTKLTAKLDLGKKYVPYLSSEVFYLISSPNVTGYYIDKLRCTAGVEYEFNRVHAIDFYYLFQSDYQVNDPVRDFVVGAGYTYSF